MKFNDTYHGSVLGKQVASKFYGVQNTIYDYIIGANMSFYALIIIFTLIQSKWAILGNIKPYLTTINNCFSLYISFYLMARFNRFRIVKCSALDRKVVFHAGILLFLNILFGQYLAYYDNIVNYLRTKLGKIKGTTVAKKTTN